MSKEKVVAGNEHGWGVKVTVDGGGVHLGTGSGSGMGVRSTYLGLYLTPDDIDALVLHLLKNKKYAL